MMDQDILDKLRERIESELTATLPFPVGAITLAGITHSIMGSIELLLREEDEVLEQTDIEEFWDAENRDQILRVLRMTTGRIMPPLHDCPDNEPMCEWCASLYEALEACGYFNLAEKPGFEPISG